MSWPRVIGQERVKQLLLRALSGDRLSHAYLFYGGEGVGKDALALELARVMHCAEGKEEACGRCDSCIKLDSLQHPDVKLVVALPVGKGEKADDAPLAKLADAEVRTIQEELHAKGQDPYHRVAIPRANIIKINSIREVRREASMTTTDGRRRVVIISEADAMGDEAANTLLKTLEEPSGNTMLILTTAHSESLLPTIRSRCQKVRFDPLTEEEIREALVTRAGADASRAALVSRLANGNYRRALDLLDDDVDGQRRDVVAFVRHALASNAVALSESIDALAEGRDRAAVVRFLVLMLMWFRDVLVESRGGKVINTDQQDDVKRFLARFPGADLFAILAEVEHAVSLLERNVYIKLVLLRLAVRLKALVLPGAAEADRTHGFHKAS
jgi:DNA polymerase-3 subunit delta'